MGSGGNGIGCREPQRKTELVTRGVFCGNRCRINVGHMEKVHGFQWKAATHSSPGRPGVA